MTNRSSASSAAARAARLTLAVFGKHPGWNDHLPGIGVGTEALVRIKHALYDTGMRGCIDSGAWKKLEAGKRLEGFDHTFLWLQTGSVILGGLHSSEDGLRRKEYPLVLCVDGEGLPPGNVLARAQSELNRLRDACQATRSAEIVTTECRAAQERLAARLNEAEPPAEEAASPDARRRFLDHPDLGPERVGLLRILHELGISGDTSTRPGQRSRHARLPLASDSHTQSLLLWVDFLRGAIPLPTPLLLFSRAGAEWLDVIVGEPTSDDLICLQSSTNAQPLATQIPYDLGPKLAPYLKALELRFLNSAQSASLPVPPSATNGPATPPLASVGAGADSPLRGSLNRLVLASVVIVVAVALMAAIWVMRGDRGRTSGTQPPAAATNTVPVEPTPAKSNAVTSPPAPDEARLKADAESKRLAEEKQRQDAQLRIQREVANAEAEQKRIAEEKQTAENQAKVAAPLPATLSAEETQAQAQAKERAAGVVQIALAQGNYSRAIEIIQKWPGDSSFSALTARITAETNQLAQAQEWLRVGNYAAILTNRLPENSTFKELQASAEKEKQILDQTQKEFDAGTYSFLQRPEAQDLKAKAPFMKLLQAGDYEAKQLKAAQLLQAENRPKEALALLDQQKLAKPSFVPIRTWANAELAKREAGQRELRQAQTAFQQGEYAQALALCAKYPGVSEFADLTNGIAMEQRKLENWQSRFAAADYTFLDESAAAYASKPPFARLTNQSRLEQASLVKLSAFTNQAGGWTNLPGELRGLPDEVQRKQPFTDLQRWAQQKAEEEQKLKSQSPAWLDDVFEPMLVAFGVLRPKDPWLQSPKAAQARKIEGFVADDNKAELLNEVQRLRREYEQRGWLDERNRRKYLDELEKAIKRW